MMMMLMMVLQYYMNEQYEARVPANITLNMEIICHLQIIIIQLGLTRAATMTCRVGRWRVAPTYILSGGTCTYI